MANFPLTLSDLQTYVGELVNDPSFTRYTTTLINSQLDLAQSRWNMEAKICRWTDYVALTANTYRYGLSSSLTLPIITDLRVTLKGIPLTKKSKDYFDMYSAIDWTTSQGTPQEYCIDLNSNPPSFILHPTPQANDVTSYSNAVGITSQNPLGIEYLTPHQQMSLTTDTPWTVNGVTNSLTPPYVAGLGLDVAASLLEPDPTPETKLKAGLYRSQANSYLSIVQQLYADLETSQPLRMQGGRNWRFH
jgi:hypothetical protein